MFLASLLALTTISVSNDASADRRPRRDIRAEPTAPSKAPLRQLRSVTATQLQTELKADAPKLLGELRHGLRVTEVSGLTGASTLLSSIAGLVGGNPAGVQLRFRRDGVAIVKLSRYAGIATPASPATPPAGTTTPAPATKTPPAETKAPAAPADDEDE